MKTIIFVLNGPLTEKGPVLQKAVNQQPLHPYTKAWSLIDTTWIVFKCLKYGLAITIEHFKQPPPNWNKDRV